MNCEEFNNKYYQFLEKGHYGLDIYDEKVINFLDDIFKDLILIPGFQYSQIKLKFNSCRFYSNLKSSISYLIENKINELCK